MTKPRRRTVLTAGLLACLAVACQPVVVSDVRGRRIGRAELRTVALGRTTPVEIEQRFGAPTTREPDGALTYRYTVVRRSARHVGRWTLPASERVEEHAVTFRFAHGVLMRICRSRT